MGRVEAVLFASANPVSRDDLGRVVGKGANIDLLIDDIAAELEARPYEVAAVAGGWMLEPDRATPPPSARLRTSKPSCGTFRSSTARCWRRWRITSRSTVTGLRTSSEARSAATLSVAFVTTV